MTPWQKAVHDWHKLMSYPSGDYSNPQPLSGDVLHGRMAWIDEEIDELDEAMEAKDIEETVDACLDIAYFLLGSFDIAGLVARGRYWEIIQTGNYRNPDPFSERAVTALEKVASDARALTAAMWHEYDRGWAFQRFELMDATLKQIAHAFTAMGIDPRPLFDEVNASNVSKYPPVYREDGKIGKGPNYRKPDLKPLLRAQGVL
jgi:predicted HAD superfamily Cof-like phosphohydrolase